jgi:hypothetical protein
MLKNGTVPVNGGLRVSEKRKKKEKRKKRGIKKNEREPTHGPELV